MRPTCQRVIKHRRTTADLQAAVAGALLAIVGSVTAVYSPGQLQRTVLIVGAVIFLLAAVTTFIMHLRPVGVSAVLSPSGIHVIPYDAFVDWRDVDMVAVCSEEHVRHVVLRLKRLDPLLYSTVVDEIADPEELADELPVLRPEHASLQALVGKPALLEDPTARRRAEKLVLMRSQLGYDIIFKHDSFSQSAGALVALMKRYAGT